MCDIDQELDLRIEIVVGPFSDEKREKITRFCINLKEELETFRLDLEKIFLSQKLYTLCNQDGHIVALAGLRKASLIRVFFTVVQKQYQGKGLGKHLMSRLMSEMGSFSLLMLSVERSNTRARKLYKRFGFRTIFRRKTMDYMLYRNKAGVLMSPLIVVALLFKSLCTRAD